MLQAHSLLWHYLWVAPNVLLLLLAFLVWRRGLRRIYPIFFVFSIVAAIEQLTVYAADVLPWVPAVAFWTVLWSGLLVEALVKILLIGEVFAHVFGPYSSLARLGKMLIRGIGAVLVLVATLTAALSPVSNPHLIVSGPHLLEQTVYIIASGLLLFIFLFSAYFRLTSDRISLGIGFGLAASAFVHLGTWAFAANNSSKQVSVGLDFVNMATYHACVLLWFYYLLVPGKVATQSAVPLPENNLDVWNRELERLVHP
jgi:hypothetical protein